MSFDISCFEAQKHTSCHDGATSSKLTDDDAVVAAPTLFDNIIEHQSESTAVQPPE